jgi:protein CASC3
MATQPPPPQTQPTTTVQQQQQAQQAQKYQAAFYAANPASEYAAQQAALMQAAMVEKYQFTQQTPPAQYLPPQQAQQIYMPTQTQPTQQQQILNYVSTIQPQAPAAAYPQYTNYQNYNIQPQPAATVPPPQQAPPPVAQTQPQPIYQTQGGLTYYPNTQLQTAHQQRIIQPQRRPNPIPILAPPDHKSKTSSSNADENTDDKGGSGSAENIDHILDNMFVQRPMTNIISLKDPTPVIQNDNKNEDQINDGMSVS